MAPEDQPDEILIQSVLTELFDEPAFLKQISWSARMVVECQMRGEIWGHTFIDMRNPVVRLLSIG